MSGSETFHNDKRLTEILELTTKKKKKSVFTFRSLKKEKSIIFFPLSLCLGLYTAETEIDAKTGETMNMR